MYDVSTCRLSRHKTSKRKVFLGSLQLEHILFYFHNFSAIFWVRKEIKFGYSCSLYQILHLWYRQSSFLHSATPRARDGLSVSLVQDLAEKALVPKLDSYNRWPAIQSDVPQNSNEGCLHCNQDKYSCLKLNLKTLPLYYKAVVFDLLTHVDQSCMVTY